MAATKTILAALMAAGLLAACSSDSENAAATGAGGANAGGLGLGGSGSFRPGSQEDLAANIGDRVLFDTDRSSVRADQRSILERVAPIRDGALLEPDRRAEPRRPGADDHHVVLHGFAFDVVGHEARSP